MAEPLAPAQGSPRSDALPELEPRLIRAPFGERDWPGERLGEGGLPPSRTWPSTVHMARWWPEPLLPGPPLTLAPRPDEPLLPRLAPVPLAPRSNESNWLVSTAVMRRMPLRCGAGESDGVPPPPVESASAVCASTTEPILTELRRPRPEMKISQF